jgi:2-polyprenyl-3-methyl-5-hydroxy-6-metoxy-1,4-benzoquinol methylase
MDKSQIAINVFNKYAALYQDKFMDVHLYSEGLDFFSNNITSDNAEILELACGPGNITKYLLDKRPGFKITGIDLAPNMIDLAKINNPLAKFQIMDCRDIDKIDKEFDAIMCGFCLPYLTKEETIKLIANASKLLRHSGIFYLSTMEDDHSKSGYKSGSTGDEIFIHYHQADYLTQTLKENHFSVLKLIRKNYWNDDGTQTTDLMLIATKQSLQPK